MALVLAGECSYSESGVSKNSYEKQDEVDMRDEEDGVCKGSISNLAHYIPLDLTLEILTRLPVKSLKRFQCVSTDITRQMVTLPDIKASSTGGLEREHMYLFLGYDPVGHEYKALCSTVLYGEPCQHHRVLTLGRGNLSWRRIKGRKTFRYIVVTKGICINGMVYFGGWMTTQRQEKKARIFQFDVRSERMVSIRTYAPVITQGSLINYYGKLAMFYPYPCFPLSGFDLWVLEDLDKGKWIRTEFNAHPLVSDLSGNIQSNMSGTSKTGKIILGPLKLPPKHEPLYIFYYNEWKGKNFIRRVELEGFEEFGCNHTVMSNVVVNFFSHRTTWKVSCLYNNVFFFLHVNLSTQVYVSCYLSFLFCIVGSLNST